MQVSDPNNIKIYNLSAGKSLPEWLSERKRRALLKKDVDIRRRLELIQDFDMPGLSTSVRVSGDGQYIMATGTYKPRIKCFDVNNLSLKFERCFDSESVTFEILSDDYSKIVFLQCDRYIEFHSAQGRYYRLRIPKFGRDMKYHYSTCDLFIVGASSDIYRLNLERGQFLTPFSSTTSAINRCTVNEVHQLLLCGTQEGKIEAWDPRSKGLVGTLDCAFNCMNEYKSFGSAGLPSVTALKCNGTLELGVGMATGHVALYDIRSNRPFYVKDHMYGLPIKDVDFHRQMELVYSMDSSSLKMWDKNNGKLYTSIEASADFNNLCVVQNTGLLFIANESTKIQTYYIPSLGPAPKWASFLDNLTEELEESNSEIVYDDYKFVTKQELIDVGLDHLIGTNLLRAYMHGYFVDIRLYNKAMAVANPFEFEEYRKRKIREVIEKDRTNRVQVNKLPKVNKDLALKIINDQINKKKKPVSNLLEDNRFKGLFENPDFEINKNADEYRLLNPVLSRLDKSKKKELEKAITSQEFEVVHEDDHASAGTSSDGDDDYTSDDSSDEEAWKKEMKKQHKIIQKEHRMRERLAEEEERNAKQPKLFELRHGEEFTGVHNIQKKMNKSSLGERLENENTSVKLLNSVGSREMTFTTNKSKRDRQIDERNRRHREERRKLIRPTYGIKSKLKRPFFNKKRK